MPYLIIEFIINTFLVSVGKKVCAPNWKKTTLSVKMDKKPQTVFKNGY